MLMQGMAFLCDYLLDTDDISLSDCVDRRLSYRASTYGDNDQESDGKYYDKCCYIRAMIGGTVFYGCSGLNRNETMDIVEAIKLHEKQMSQSFKLIDFLKEGQDVKIYSLNCKASFIKFLASVFMLFFLLF